MRLRLVVGMIVRQVGADDDQCLRPAPEPLDHLRHLLASRPPTASGTSAEIAEHLSAGTATAPRANAPARAPRRCAPPAAGRRARRSPPRPMLTRPSGVSNASHSGSARPAARDVMRRAEQHHALARCRARRRARRRRARRRGRNRRSRRAARSAPSENRAAARASRRRRAARRLPRPARRIAGIEHAGDCCGRTDGHAIICRPQRSQAAFSTPRSA